MEEYIVECSEKEDFSDGKVIHADKNKSSVVFDNLHKATDYYVRLTAVKPDGNNIVKTLSFRTSDKGPRPLTIDGIHNVRDIGGYRTADGEVTKQDMIYRGGSLTPTQDYPDICLTEAGEKYLREELKIKLDMDLRGNSEGGVSESPIKGVKIDWFGVGGYDSAFSDGYKNNYKKVFETFANKANYPIYMHCTGGADRTGTVTFLLNALLGVSKDDLIKDYEYTSFSVYRERNTKQGVYSHYFKPFMEKFEKLKGDTYSKKVENYLLGLGLSQTEIYNIKAIMTGKELKATLSAQPIFNKYEDNYFNIEIINGTAPTQVKINNEDVEFEITDTGVRIENSKMPALTEGTVNGSCIVNNQQLNFTFKFSAVHKISGFDFSKGDVVTDVNNPLSEGEKIAYDGTIWEFKVLNNTPSVQNGPGEVYFFIGSYGVKFRGGCFRMTYRDTDGEIYEVSPRQQYVYSNIENKVLAMSIMAINNTQVELDLYINDVLVYEYTFTRLTDKEIPEENSTCVVNIGTANTSKLILTSK